LLTSGCERSDVPEGIPGARTLADVTAVSGVSTSTGSSTEQRRALRPRVPGLVAWAVRVVAVLALLDVILPERHVHHLNRTIDALSDGTAFAAGMIAAGALLLIAGGLRRRKRRAWATAVLLAGVGVIANVEIPRPRVVLLNLLVLALLTWTRRDFTARSEPRSRLGAVRVFVVMGAFSMTAGYLLTGRTTTSHSFGHRLEQVFYGLLGFAPDLTFRHTSAMTFTEIALTTLGGLTALLTVAALLAPVRKPPQRTVDAENGVRRLLSSFGERDSLGYFALRQDKSVIFSVSEKAAVAYRVIGGVTLASGDPLGDPEAWPGAISAWLAEAEQYAWIPGVIAASEEAAIIYRRAGLDALELGDEAVLDLDTFSLSGRQMRVVRQAVNRVRRCGYTVQIDRQREVSAEDLAELSLAAHRLRGGEVERGFSMALGRIGHPDDPEVVLARARDAEGRLVAVLSFVPWGQDGLSLDVMRRERNSENGTIELVIVTVAEVAKTLGIRRMSLNFAVFRSVFERGSRVGAGPVLRMWHRALLFASRWWQIESLYRANAKYGPDWEPRFVCFRKAAELPRVGLAALEAEAFIKFPRLRWLAR
jgi:lysyl-tRNA synthetase class 2